MTVAVANALSTVAVLALPTACSHADEPVRYLTQPAVACPAVDALAPQRTADPLPAGFWPVTVVRCRLRIAPFGPGRASGSTGLVWSDAARSNGPFDALVRALRLPPQPRDGTAACPASYVLPMVLALTDGSGGTLLPAIPGTACGDIRAEVRAAVEATPWEQVGRADMP